MRYIDPYQFFELQLARPEDLTSSVLRRARQRKLAEFELSADGFLYWEGEAVEKRMALDLAEALEDPKRQKFYWRIHQDKALTTFFKGDQVAPLKTIFINSIVQDPEFRDFCSPFFATTFDRILRPATEARDWMDARFLLGKSELIRVEDMDRAYGPIIRFMERSRSPHTFILSGDYIMLFKGIRPSEFEFLSWDLVPD